MKDNISPCAELLTETDSSVSITNVGVEFLSPSPQEWQRFRSHMVESMEALNTVLPKGSTVEITLGYQLVPVVKVTATKG